MNITDIYSCPRGSRFLISCPSKVRENMVDFVCHSMPADFKAATALNSCCIASIEIVPDEMPNRFNDLLGLCAKLISTAGRRSHFEGLLIVNISALSYAFTSDNIVRLKALGELLAMKDGLASRCITLLYGPEKEYDVLSCADHLDFDGKLKVICYEQPNKLSLSELLAESKLSCASPSVEGMLKSTLTDMASCDGFNASKFIRLCGNDTGLITKDAISDMLNDPYSYINRAKKGAHLSIEESPKRKVGFQLTR